MKTRILMFAAALVALCLTSAQARIGETEAELAKRYGAPLTFGKAKVPTDALGNPHHVYRFKDFTIMAVIENGVCVSEMITKADDGARITSDEFVQIVSGYEERGRGHEEWQFRTRPGGEVMGCMSKDKRMFALNVTEGKEMIIQRTDYSKRVQAERKKQEAMRLRGF